VVAIRKAGDLPELINAAIRARGYDVLNPVDRYDYGLLQQRIAQEGSALLRPNDLRWLFDDSVDSRRGAQMTPQQRLFAVAEYLSEFPRNTPGAPMLFPVRSRKRHDHLGGLGH
jgi:hypothetical protein